MKITTELLKKHDACKPGIKWFKERYPNGATLEKIQEKGIHPSISYVYWLMKKIPEFRNEDKWNYFMSLNPTDGDVIWVLQHCPEFHIQKCWNDFMSLKPSANDIEWVLLYSPELEKFVEDNENND